MGVPVAFQSKGILSIVVDERVLGGGLFLGLFADSVAELDASNHLGQ